MHKCVKQNIIMHFIIQKLKNKHTFLKKHAKLRKLNPLILTEREDSKTRYFPPKGEQNICSGIDDRYRKLCPSVLLILTISYLGVG